MANPHRGEVEIEIEGKAYRLVFSTNAICEAEEVTNKSVLVLISTMDRVSTIRAMFWAAIKEHQPGVSLKDAGNLMQQAGAGVVMRAVNEALALAFPKTEAKSETENP